MMDVHWKPFLAALILALLGPAVVAGCVFGLLFWFDSFENAFAMLAFIIIYGTFIGAPTYLTFGTVAFLRAVRRGKPLWIAAMTANFVSAPVLLIVYRLSGPDWEDAILATVFHVLLGCIFSAVWGALFGVFYERFTGVRQEDEE